MGKSAKIRHRRRRRHERWTPAKAEQLRKTLDEMLEDSFGKTLESFTSMFQVMTYVPPEPDPIIAAYPAKQVVVL
jgi:hypothetical protein